MDDDPDVEPCKIVPLLFTPWSGPNATGPGRGAETRAARARLDALPMRCIPGRNRLAH